MGHMGLVLKGLVRHICSVARRTASAFRAALRPVSGPFPLLGGLIADVGRSRSELIVENALLRQQLIVASRSVKRPTFLGTSADCLSCSRGSCPCGVTPCSWSSPIPCFAGIAKDSGSGG